MYAEIYNLKGGGYTFPCHGVSLCGGILRVKNKFGDWYFVSKDTNGDIDFHDEFWTDFGVADEPHETFKMLSFKEASTWLEMQ